jgi:lipid II:glycine glycyltransferase (peptidoglycan interpeptide bridge formation enzyme)
VRETHTSLQVHVNHERSHPEWDAWVAAAPGGHHLQTAGWARVKAAAGWHATRVALARGEEIAAGCQLLIRRIPLLGSVAYAPRAPLMSTDDPELLPALLDTVRRVASDKRIVYLKLQPPVDRDDLPEQLRAHGFVSSELQAAPVASVRLRLAEHADPDSIFKALRATTRSRIRQAQKRGVEVRSGGVQDLPLLQSLLEATAVRQGFAPYPAHYYRCLWDAFAPSGQAMMQIVEHEGTALAASLLIAFGDTVLYKIGAWDGSKGTPPGANALMHWTAIRRAHAAGFRYYDFEGIPLDVARAVQGGAKASSSMGVAFFKLGFGGEVVIYPGTFDLSLSRAVGPLVGRVVRDQRVRKLVHHMSGRNT